MEILFVNTRNASPSSALATGATPGHWRGELLQWWPIIAGLLLLYVPSLIDLFKGIWSQDEQMHGPIVLSIACWLIYRNWPAMMAASEGNRTHGSGWVFFVFALLLYTLGRSQDILLFEVGSAIWILIGVTLLTLNRPPSVQCAWSAQR